ncbi:hypothetical protein D3C73_1648690 [compost metagenome]
MRGRGDRNPIGRQVEAIVQARFIDHREAVKHLFPRFMRDVEVDERRLGALHLADNRPRHYVAGG